MRPSAPAGAMAARCALGCAPCVSADDGLAAGRSPAEARLSGKDRGSGGGRFWEGLQSSPSCGGDRAEELNPSTFHYGQMVAAMPVAACVWVNPACILSDVPAFGVMAGYRGTVSRGNP